MPLAYRYTVFAQYHPPMAYFVLSTSQRRTYWERYGKGYPGAENQVILASTIKLERNERDDGDMNVVWL